METTGRASARGTTEQVELSRAQRAFARKVAESKAIVPHLYLRSRVAVGDASDLTALVIAAAGRALREHPKANGSYRDARFELHSRVNVAFVTETPDAPLAPTIFDADAKTPAEISAEIADLGERAREGSITAPELAGATFTVWPLGEDGAEEIAPPVSPPQAAALGIGAPVAIASVGGGTISAKRSTTLSLSCDQRILNGPDASRFLASIQGFLTEPESLE